MEFLAARKIIDVYRNAGAYFGATTFDAIMKHGLQQEWYQGVEDPSGYVEAVLKNLYDMELK